MTKAGTPAARPFGFTERSPHGDDEPTPRNPAAVKVVVAVPPNCAKFAERSEEEAAPLKSMSEVVALCPAAGCVHASYDARKSVPAVAAATCPPVVVFKIDPELIPEIHRFVLDAVVAVTIVVLAKGMERPVPAGAEKLIVNPLPPTSAPVPVILMAVPLLADVVATD